MRVLNRCLISVAQCNNKSTLTKAEARRTVMNLLVPPLKFDLQTEFAGVLLPILERLQEIKSQHSTSDDFTRQLCIEVLEPITRVVGVPVPMREIEKLNVSLEGVRDKLLSQSVTVVRGIEHEYLVNTTMEFLLKFVIPNIPMLKTTSLRNLADNCDWTKRIPPVDVAILLEYLLRGVGKNLLLVSGNGDVARREDKAEVSLEIIPYVGKINCKFAACHSGLLTQRELIDAVFADEKKNSGKCEKKKNSEPRKKCRL